MIEQKMSVNEKDIRKNGEWYQDPTAFAAIRKMDAERDQVSKLIQKIKTLCSEEGFIVENRIILRNEKTGKVWK